MSLNKNIRVRFAPSPTGFLHVGGLRTALYNYLFARKSKGSFILRIEDTDQTRAVEGAVENLVDALHWCGLEYDEGPDRGGDYGPYIQSERLNIYKKNIEELISKKKAYYCFCTSDRIAALRGEQKKSVLQTKYDKRCLSLPQIEIETNLKNKIPYVVRLDIKSNQTIFVEDAIRGKVEFESQLLDDQVLIKSDGYPTYHFANVVDDHLMEISHVIRGEEWLPSTPKHVLLYQAFGWDIPMFAHLPLLLNPDKSKLSKRQGDVAVEDYRSKGYLKEALINFIALLGWNPGTEQEFFYLNGLIEQFSLESVNKAGAVFDLDKLNWLNFEHLRRKSDTEMILMLKDALLKSKYEDYHYDDNHLLKIVESMRPRVTFIKDYFEKSPYFFEPPKEYEEGAKRKNWNKDTPNQLKKFSEMIVNLENPSKENYEAALKQTAQSLSIGNGSLIHAIRLAVSGVSGGPGLFDILDILGKEEIVKRIQTAINKINNE